jgi:DNA replication protein DnaC
MLANHTLERLTALGLAGMAKAFDDQQRQPDVSALTFDERLGLMIDREVTERDNRRLVTRLKFASLRQAAVVEDIDLRTPRGIDRAFFAKLVDGGWINRKQNLLITGPTGVGKSWIACALGHKACRDNRSVLYHRLPRLFEALALARGDGRYARLLKTLSRVELLILDDWGLLRWPASSAVISSRSSTTATSAVRPSSLAKCRSIIGMRSSPIPPSRTPFSTASSTMPTASPSQETACARSPPSALSLTPPAKPESTPHAGNETRPPSFGTGGCLQSERMAAFNRNHRPQSSESAARTSRTGCAPAAKARRAHVRSDARAPAVA